MSDCFDKLIRIGQLFESGNCVMQKAQNGMISGEELKIETNKVLRKMKKGLDEDSE